MGSVWIKSRKPMQAFQINRFWRVSCRRTPKYLGLSIVLLNTAAQNFIANEYLLPNPNTFANDSKTCISDRTFSLMISSIPDSTIRQNRGIRRLEFQARCPARFRSRAFSLSKSKVYLRCPSNAFAPNHVRVVRRLMMFSIEFVSTNLRNGSSSARFALRR